MFGVMNSLSIRRFETAEQAVALGFDYKGQKIKPVEITQVVVIEKGTVEGRPTVDLLLTDEEGNEFVVMLTGRLLKSIPCG